MFDRKATCNQCLPKKRQKHAHGQLHMHAEMTRLRKENQQLKGLNVKLKLLIAQQASTIVAGSATMSAWRPQVPNEFRDGPQAHHPTGSNRNP